MSSSRPLSRAVTLGLVLVLLAACQGSGLRTRIGRLFGTAQPKVTMLAPPPTAQGDQRLMSGLPVLVTPTAGLSTTVDGRPAQLANAVAERLVAADILASTRAAAVQSYVLSTRIEGADLVADLHRPDGIAAGTWRIPLETPPAETTGPALDRLATLIAAAVTGPAAPRPPAVRPRGPAIAVVVAGVEGAPGDGNTALADAMRKALAIGGLTVPDTPREGALVVHGTVEVTPRTPTLEHVILTWEVRNPAGESIATIAQENDVPAGALNHAWGPIAGAAAQGGADGVMQLVDALQRQ
ncbi:MAG: hypothetical protein PHS60_04270 [Zavarzinia sp.]|nr:hypothetical protein [Zavarzinia sp.]